jgi:segregation and condensation protein A
MIEKPVPWWRKALNYALSGIRSGFGLFPKPAGPGPLETSSQHEERIPIDAETILEPEPTLEVKESLTDRHANPETDLSVAESEVEPVSAASDAEPTPAAIAEIAAAPDSPLASADEIALAPEPLDLTRKLTLDVAPVSGPAVLAASTPPEAMRGSGDPHDSRPGDRRYPLTDELLVDHEPIAETTQPSVEEAVLAEKEFVVDEVIAAETAPDAESIQMNQPSEAGAEEPALPAQHLEPAPELPPPAELILITDREPASESIREAEEPIAEPTVALETAAEQTAEAAPAIEVEPPTELAVAIEPQPEPIDLPIVEAVAEAVAEAGSVSEPLARSAVAEPEPSLESTASEAVEVAPSEPAPVADSISNHLPNPESAVIPVAGQPAPDTVAVEKAAAKLLARQKKLDDAAELSPFSVIVGQVYTGPLDLLLDLIRQQDIDIYDIPIAKITAQFLAYVNQLKATDVDVAGEFIYTASLLIHIKSKMLLPRSPVGPDETPEDPRRELVERLLEHERFKNAAQMLQQKQILEAATWTNPGFREFQDDEGAEPEIAADTVDLVRIFRDILERARNRPVIDVQEDSVTVGQMIQFLARRLTLEDKPIALRRLLSHTRSERALVAMFLALLELVRLQAVLLRQDRAFSDIFIKKHTGFDAVMDQGLTNALDDWR